MTTAEGRVLVTPRSLSIGHPLLDRLSSAGLEPVCPAPGRTPTAAELAEDELGATVRRLDVVLPPERRSRFA